jgi:hypothetical protein
VERGHVVQRRPNQAGGSQNIGGTVDRTLPQALPEASSGVSPSHTQMDASGALGGDDEGKMGVISVSQTRLYSQSSL